jgi:hypothetical protein
MSPLRDNALVFNIQLALLGIIMVVGVFYNWRALSRIEERMESIERSFAAGGGGGSCLRGGGDGIYDGPVSDEEAEMAEAFMQNVFGNAGAYNAPSVAAAGGGVSGGVVIVEEAAPAPVAAPVAKIAAAPAPVAKAAPVAAPAAPAAPATETDDIVAAALSAKNEDSGTDDGTIISKTRLRKMNAESLREVCMSHGLPSDGTRVMLIERLMEFLYD